MVFRVGIYSLSLIIIRIVAIVLFFSISNDYSLNNMAVLTSMKYFYLGYCITESVFLLVLMIVTVKFYMYHEWLQKNKITTYQHILMQRKLKAGQNKVQPIVKVKLSKETSTYKNFALATKNKGKHVVSRHNS